MLRLLWRILRPVQGWLAIAGASLAALGLARYSGARAQRDRQRADEMQEAYQNEGTRNAIERDVSKRGGARDRLRSDWKRPE